MAQEIFSTAEKDLLVKLLGQFAAKMEKTEKKSIGDGALHIAEAAKKQKKDCEVLLNKIL